MEGDLRIEPAEGAEQVGTREQTGGRQHEHVADGVVLLLVGFARVDDRVDLAEAVETETDVLEHLRVVPLDELRPDHAGVGPEQLGHEQTHHVGRRRDVVVTQEEEPVVTLDEPEDLVERRPEAGVAGERTHERRGDHRTDTRRQLAVGVVGRQQEQCPEVRVVLIGEGLEGHLEPVTRFVHDHDGNDRRRELVVRLHDASRLAVQWGGSRSPLGGICDEHHSARCSPNACKS